MQSGLSYKPRLDKSNGHVYLRGNTGKCLHCYFYFIDEEFGLCLLRVPTWRGPHQDRHRSGRSRCPSRSVVVVPLRGSVGTAMGMARLVVVRVGMTVAVAAPVPRRCVGPTCGFEGAQRFVHDQMHGTQHVGQHMVRLQLQVVGPPCSLHGRTTNTACEAACTRTSEPSSTTATSPAPQHRAARQQEAHRAASGVQRVEAALLTQVPAQFDR
jgi:hypothetical protein